MISHVLFFSCAPPWEKVTAAALCHDLLWCLRLSTRRIRLQYFFPLFFLGGGGSLQNWSRDAFNTFNHTGIWKAIDDDVTRHKMTGEEMNTWFFFLLELLGTPYPFSLQLILLQNVTLKPAVTKNKGNEDQIIHLQKPDTFKVTTVTLGYSIALNILLGPAFLQYPRFIVKTAQSKKNVTWLKIDKN